MLAKSSKSWHFQHFFALILFVSLGSDAICQSPGRLYFFNYVTVDPARGPAFEQAIIRVNGKLQELEYQRSHYVFSTEDSHYYIVWPLASHATLDTIYLELANLEENADYQQVAAGMKKEIQTEHFFSNYSLPELAYSPENANDTGDEEAKNFYRWDWYEIRPGQESQFEKDLRLLKALCRETGVQHSYSVETGHIGKPGPFFVLDHNAEGPEDLIKSMAAMEEKLGEQGKILWRRIDSLTTKHYSQTGRYRSDLSYIATAK